MTTRQQNERKFPQEIYNAEGELVEIHEKFPVDKGHQPVKRESDQK